MELGQTRSPSDLISGSASGVRETADAWKGRAGAAVRLRDDLEALDDDGTWAGRAYDLYLERFDRQLLHWQDAGTSLQAGASALYRWADALDWAQDEAARAITLWDDAEQQSASALVAYRARMSELRRGQGLRPSMADLPFEDPSGPAHEEARDVLFNARATLEVFARDCATKLNEAADAARIPLTSAEAAVAAQRAATAVAFEIAVAQPFRSTMLMLSVAAQTLWEHPDIILELLGGAATFLGGAAVALGGAGISVTGVGALTGAPALAVAGVGVAGAGAVLVGDAAGRWSQESHTIADRQRGVDLGNGRDYEGKFAKGQENKPWVDKEEVGLDKYAEENGVEVIRAKVKVDFEGSPQNGRIYDGLEKNADGSYTAIEIKSGFAIDKYQSPGDTQRQFDDAINSGTPARGRLDGEDVVVTSVEVREVP